MVVRGVVAVVAALALAPAAHAASATSVVMLSDSGDYIGGGVPRLYHPRNAQISVSGSTAYLDVSISGGNLGDYFDLEFAAPPGRIRTPGTYVGAQRAPFREAGRPGIDISADGRGCDTIEGLFEVKALDVAADGTLQRLWIVYEQHCEGGESALFGEVRIGVPAPDGELVAPGLVRWPAADIGWPGAVVPVTVVAAQGVTVRPNHQEGNRARGSSMRSFQPRSRPGDLAQPRHSRNAVGSPTRAPLSQTTTSQRRPGRPAMRSLRMPNERLHRRRPHARSGRPAEACTGIHHEWRLSRIATLASVPTWPPAAWDRHRW